MTTHEEIAKKVAKAIKENLATQKKNNADFKLLSVEICTYSKVDEKTRKWGRFICVGRKAIALVEDDYTERGVMRYLATEIANLKATKGWGRLSTKTEKLSYGSGWNCSYYTYINEVSLLAEPCKEFKSLINYITKYGKTTLKETDIFGVCIGGKRGRVYGEESDRHYICHYPKRCEKALEELRKLRGTKDTMKVAIKSVDDIDPWELEVSIRNEVEFSGYRQNMAEVTITTPSGKTKSYKIAI